MMNLCNQSDNLVFYYFLSILFIIFDAQNHIIASLRLSNHTINNLFQNIFIALIVIIDNSNINYIIYLLLIQTG